MQAARAGLDLEMPGADAAEHPITAAGGSAVVTASEPVITPLAGVTARASAAGLSVTHARGTLGLAALAAVPSTAFGAVCGPPTTRPTI